MKDYFQQKVPNYDVSLEKGTKDIPNDGKYYILRKGKIVYSTKILKKAQIKFDDLLKKMGYKPNVKEKLAPEDIKKALHKQNLDKFFQAYDNYWNNSYKFRKGGMLNKR